MKSHLDFLILPSSEETITYKHEVLIPEKKQLTHDHNKEKGLQQTKSINATEEQSKVIFNNMVVAYYPSDRYVKPKWLNDSYATNDSTAHFNLNVNLSGRSKNPIMVNHHSSDNQNWLLDIIADSRCDLIFTDSVIEVRDDSKLNEIKTLNICRDNVETIMSEILDVPVYFDFNYRNRGRERFSLKKREDHSVLVSSLDDLSTGQLAIFNIFTTIIRYSDNFNINTSVDLSTI